MVEIEKKRVTNDVKIYYKSLAYNGYTLFAPLMGNSAYLIDMRGNICQMWEMKHPAGPHGKLLPNGNLLWMGRGPGAIEELGGNATELVEVDWDGNEVWKYEDPYMHHDFVHLDNGNLVILMYEKVPDKLQSKIKGGIPGTEVDGKIIGVSAREINREKETIWEWHGYKHLDIDKDIECALDPRFVWGYTNSLAVFPNGDLLLSLRQLNTIARIDRKSGDIIWRWGPEHMIGHQHCVSILENGNILLFDNGYHRQPFKPSDPPDISDLEASRPVELNPKNGEIVWEYRNPDIYTSGAGSAYRLPNGNTLLCESFKGTFYEITYNKEIAWKYVSPFSFHRKDIWGWIGDNFVFQAHRYGSDFAGFKGKDLDPERYEWTIRKKSKGEIEEERIMDRLGKTGY